MNPSNLAPYTLLESLYLFREIFTLGFQAPAFEQISDRLTNNKLIKNGSTYDARRLTPDGLQELFLHLLWEELRTESEAAQASQPQDADLSPAAKKRKLQPPPVPTLKDVRHHHLENIVAIANRLEEDYRDQAIRSIQEEEARFDRLQAEIAELENEERQAKEKTSGGINLQNGLVAATNLPNGTTANGSRPSSGPSTQGGPKNGNISPQQPASSRAGPAALGTATGQQVARSPRLTQVPALASSTKPPEAAALPNSAPVLQAPRGVAPFPPRSVSPAAHPPAVHPPVAQGAQRPDASARPKQPAPSQPSQAQSPLQSQLSWQPPYQPPRHGAQQPGHRPIQPSPPGAQRNTGLPVQQRELASEHAPQLPQQDTQQPPLPEAAQITGQPALLSTPSKAGGHHASDPAKTQPPQTSPVPELSGRQAAIHHQPSRDSHPQHAQTQLKPALPYGSYPQKAPIPPTGSRPGWNDPNTPARQSVLAGFTGGGSGTKWKSNPTPSTPKPSASLASGLIQSPAVEPLSPMLNFTKAPSSPQPLTKKTSPKQPQSSDVAAPHPPKRRGRPPRNTQPPLGSSSPTQIPKELATPTKEVLQEKPANDPAAETKLEKVAKVEKIENGGSTPRPPTEAGDTTADESVVGKRQRSGLAKRKRRDSSPTPMSTPAQTAAMSSLAGMPPIPPNEVFWTRAFNKVSGSAMEQIVHHRSANMFAHPIRERDAPGYSKVILRPQDLKSIRAAITHGNKTASQAAANLPDGDPGTSSVRLPISEELVPPKGIINSSQLDRELAHMFSNAIMYNPDPFHGPGSAFLRQDDVEDGDAGDGASGENVLGYKVDEFGVVKDARAMFVEVEKMVSELRSAEIQRSRPALATGTSTRHASVAAGTARDGSVPRDEGGSTVEDADEQTATEAETVSNAPKRRRTARG